MLSVWPPDYRAVYVNDTMNVFKMKKDTLYPEDDDDDEDKHYIHIMGNMTSMLMVLLKLQLYSFAEGDTTQL